MPWFSVLRSILKYALVIFLTYAIVYGAFDLGVRLMKSKQVEDAERKMCYAKCHPYAIAVLANKCFCNTTLKRAE